MAGIRALQKRVARLERADMPQRSPFVIWFGSFGLFVKQTIWPGILDGSLDKLEMIDIVAARFAVGKRMARGRQC